MPYLIIMSRRSWRRNSLILTSGYSFGHAPQLGVLLAHEFGTQRGEFDVEVLFGQVEIRRKGGRDVAVLVPFQVEGARLVFPADVVVVQDAGEGFFDLVCKLWPIRLRLRHVCNPFCLDPSQQDAVQRSILLLRADGPALRRRCGAGSPPRSSSVAQRGCAKSSSTVVSTSVLITRPS